MNWTSKRFINLVLMFIPTVAFGGTIQPRTPGVPTNLTANAAGENSVFLEWDDNTTNEDGFKIERRSENQSFTLVATVSGSTNGAAVAFSDNGVLDNTHYYYRVSAYDGSGETGYSNVAEAATKQARYSISGRIVSELDYSPLPGATVSIFNRYTLEVPRIDSGAAVSENVQGGTNQEIAVSEQFNLTGVKIYFKITHTYIGDLKVTLMHPDGTRVILHDRSGGGSDNLEGTYPTSMKPVQSMDVFAGKPSGGSWNLLVEDLGGGDSGTLDSVQLTLDGDGGVTATATADGSGNYVLQSVPSGLTSLRAELQGFQFSPATHEVDLRQNTNYINFEGKP